MPKEKILVIDDSLTVCEILRMALMAADFDVVLAHDGEEGLKKAFEEHPDMIIVDVNMPKLNGYEVVERLRKGILTTYIPIMMLTGSEHAAFNEIKGLSLGIDYYATKPFEPEVIVARVKALLERSRFSISLNPLTLLPGNVSIDKEITNRIEANLKFAVLYIDLDNFKSFNDYYGFDKGDKVIKHTADIILEAVSKQGNANDFIGHIGGDDFIVISTPEKIEVICREIIDNFDRTITGFYDEHDLKQGFIEIENRQHELERFKIMAISIGVVSNVVKEITHLGEVSVLGTQMKSAAKKLEGSTYIVDRRKN